MINTNRSIHEMVYKRICLLVWYSLQNSLLILRRWWEIPWLRTVAKVSNHTPPPVTDTLTANRVPRSGCGEKKNNKKENKYILRTAKEHWLFETNDEHRLFPLPLWQNSSGSVESFALKTGDVQSRKQCWREPLYFSVGFLFSLFFFFLKQAAGRRLCFNIQQRFKNITTEENLLEV